MQLTLAECLVKPFELGQELSIQYYQNSIKTTDFLEVKSVTRTILKEAAKNKAVYRNKLPDSIHLATALQSGCAIFVTNDANIKTPDNVTQLVLNEIATNH